jgi:hypothetical protein
MKRNEFHADFRIPVDHVNPEESLPEELWKTCINETCIRTDGDVIGNEADTMQDIDIVLDWLNP